ncbi:MAG TPA: hypothetical protein VHQ41_01795 [Patescibacteria group bacterium]|jgi:hypothetical protein|nr:hypothetical protein [Patescibacteria group bacterium]
MASIEIPERDVALFRMLKEDGVIHKIQPELLKVNNGYIFAPCSDCDHFVDLGSHFSTLIKSAGKKMRPWPIPMPGGALWLANSDLLNNKVGKSINEAMFFSADFAIREKGIRSFYPFSHAPCGAAGKFNLSLFDQFEIMDNAQEYIRNRYSDIPDLEVKSFFHVCYPGEIRKTRQISISKWRENIDKYVEFDYTPGRMFQTAAG